MLRLSSNGREEGTLESEGEREYGDRFIVSRQLATFRRIIALARLSSLIPKDGMETTCRVGKRLMQVQLDAKI